MSVAKELLSRPNLLYLIVSDVREEMEEYLAENKKEYLLFFPKYFHIKPSQLSNNLLLEGLSNYLKFEDNKPKNEEKEEEENTLLLCLIFWWTDKRREIYESVEKQLKEINPEIEKIGELNETQSNKICSHGILKFGALTFLQFSLLNGLKLEESVLRELEKKAKEELEEEMKQRNDLKQSYENISFLPQNVSPSKQSPSKSGLRPSSFGSAFQSSSDLLKKFAKGKRLDFDESRKKMKAKAIIIGEEESEGKFEEEGEEGEEEGSVFKQPRKPCNSKRESDELEGVGVCWRSKSDKTYTLKRASFIIPRNQLEYNHYLEAKECSGWLEKFSKKKTGAEGNKK